MKFSRIAESVVIRFKLIQFSVALNIPSLTARLALLVSKLFYTGSEKTVLCIGRPIFNEDIRELAKHGSTLNYLIVPKFVFISIFNHYLSKMPLTHVKYYEIRGFSHEKKMYGKFLKAFLSELLKVTKIDAVLSANYVYSWQQEFAVACKEARVPFIVLFKEGISPMYKKGINAKQAYDMLVSEYTNNKFTGDKLLVYNENTQHAFIRQNIRGIDPDTVETVGIPRLDRYFDMKSKGNNVLFFSFYLGDKLRHLNLDKEIIGEYIELEKTFHVEVMKFAKSNPDRKVVIKTKRNGRYPNYVKTIAEENGCSNLQNLVITNTGDVYNHIKNAFAIIGYNSTSLLEGFAAGRLIMTPDFRNGIIHDFFEEYPNLANYVKSMEDINRVIERGRANVPDDEELRSLLHDRIYIPDGQACKRTEASIRKTIEIFQSMS